MNLLKLPFLFGILSFALSVFAAGEQKLPVSIHSCGFMFGTVAPQSVDVGQYNFANFGSSFWDGKTFEGKVLTVWGFPEGKQYFLPAMSEMNRPLSPTMAATWGEVLELKLEKPARDHVHRFIAEGIYRELAKERSDRDPLTADAKHKYELVVPEGLLGKDKVTLYMAWEDVNTGMGSFINNYLFREKDWASFNYTELYPWHKVPGSGVK